MERQVGERRASCSRVGGGDVSVALCKFPSGEAGCSGPQSVRGASR